MAKNGNTKDMKIAILDREDGNMERMLASLMESNQGKHFIRFTSVFALVTYIYDERKGDVDLLFIHLEDENDNNIQAARDIQNYFPHIRIIFFSRNTNCAENIFQAFPSYFLKIPVKEEKLRASLERVQSELKEEFGQTINIISWMQTHRIRFSSINYIESEGRKLNIFTTDNLYKVNMTIGEMMEKLPSNFIQCHRSYVVNMDKVLSYAGDTFELVTNEYIPVARPRQKEIKNIVSKYYISLKG